MSKAEEYIKKRTRGKVNHITENFPWVPVVDARKAVEIAREEMLNEICEWIGKQKDLLEDSFSDPNDFADILKQAMKDE